MAMSQGERMNRLLEQQGRFRSRQQTRDASEYTHIVQAKSSRIIFAQNRSPNSLGIPGSQVVSATDRAIPANVYNGGQPVPSCCSETITDGANNFSGSLGLAQKAQGCAICPTDNYWLFNGYAIDMSGEFVKGGYCCPVPPLPNTAKQTAAEKCANCLRFYFPNPAQPSVCINCSSPYPQSALYPPAPIDWELRRYGEAGVPQVSSHET
jgi:hypothetical protein